MNSQLLTDTAKLLFANQKGLLAMDESTGTCNKRFEKLGIPQTVEARRAYRELIVTTQGWESRSAAQSSTTKPFVSRRATAHLCQILIAAGVTPGIKVDTGAKELAVIRGKRSQKAWTDCAIAFRNIFKWVRALPNGALSLPSAVDFRVGAAWKPMPMLWLAMRRCARRQASSCSRT